MKARALILTLGCLSLFALPVRPAEGATAERPPNIVVILADDLGYGSLNCYGAPTNFVRTPHCDRLAREGVRFTDAHTPSSVCSPTRYALLTGRYGWRTGLKWGVVNMLDPLQIETNRLTVASLLKRKGYNTAAIGKWHLGFGTTNTLPAKFTTALRPGPNDLGFDTFFGIPHNHNDPTGIYLENDGVQGLRSDVLSPYGMTFYGAPFMGIDAPQREEEQVMSVLTDRALDWLKRQDAAKPFFLYFAPVAVHHPCTPSARTKGSSGCGAYGDWIHELDVSVGRLLDALDKNGQADNTLVIFTSDNGGVVTPRPDEPEAQAQAAGFRACGALRGGKQSIFEGGTRVPYIARWPGKIEPGRVCDEPLSLADTLATVAALVNEPLPPAAQGAEDSFNVLPALLGQPHAKPLRPGMILHSAAGVYAIRQGPWKWIEGKPAQPGQENVKNDNYCEQLYNLERDLSEKENVLNQFPEVAAELRKTLELSRKATSTREPALSSGAGATAGFEKPTGIYINWAAYDELSDKVLLTETLAMRQLEELIRLRKLGVQMDYYLMDCNWFEPSSGYRQFRKSSWPEGPERWLKICRENGIKPGLWLSSNTLFGKMTVPPAWSASHDVPAKSFSMYEGGFLEDFTNVMQFWVEQGVELFKFDFVNFWAATTNSSGLALVERRYRNRVAFHDAMVAFRQRNPQVRTLAYNGFIDIPLKPTLPEFRKWPVPREFLGQLLDVFDGIYCGDPALADVPTQSFWRSKDIYSDHQVRNWEFLGVPLDRIDSSAFMVGTTGTCYGRRTSGWKAMLLLSLARGGWANTYYGDLSLLSDEDARWFARAQSIFLPLQSKLAITSFGAVPGAGQPYGFLAQENEGALMTVVNPRQSFAKVTLPLPGEGRLLFADAGFTPPVRDGSVTLGPEQMVVIGFGNYADACHELGRDTDSRIPEESAPVQADFISQGTNVVSATLRGLPANRAIRVLYQQFDKEGKPKRSGVFGDKGPAGKVFSIKAEQEGRPVPIQINYNRSIWSGLSWAAGEIRAEDLDPAKPLKLTFISLEPNPVEIRAQVHAVKY